MAKQILPESPSGIYEILNTVTDKRYVGSAQNFIKRWREHLKGLKAGRHHSRHLQSSWDKHGAEAFVFQPILYCEPAELLEYEQLCIDEMNSAYNICRVAGSTRGTVKSTECRQKISEKAKGREWTEEQRVKITAAMTGRKMSEDFCEKLRGNQYAKGSKHTDEWKAANAERMRGQKRPKDAEYRRKISEALKGRKLSEEHKAAVSAAMTGVKRGPRGPLSAESLASFRDKIKDKPNNSLGSRRTPEQRAAMSERSKGKVRSEAAKAKGGEAMRAAWADPERRTAMLKAREDKKTPEKRAETLAKKKAVRRTEDSKEKTREAMRTRWSELGYRERVLKARAEARSRKAKLAKADENGL
jgi:group I intron endonuclease